METERLEDAEVHTDLRLPNLSGNISDDEEDPMNSEKMCKLASGSSVAETAKAMQSCLLSLAADYGSDSDDGKFSSHDYLIVLLNFSHMECKDVYGFARVRKKGVKKLSAVYITDCCFLHALN